MSSRLVPALFLTAALAVAVVGCGGDDDSSSGVDLGDKTFEDLTASSTVEVDAVDNNFKPAYIEVKAGTTVTFTNAGRSEHNVLPVEEGAFDPIDVEEFEPGTSQTVTFDEVGDVPYYCSLHGTTTQGMVGAVRVVE